MKAGDMADEARIRDVLTGLSVAEHPGDVADYLDDLAELLGQPKGEWDDDLERYVWPWEDSNE